jgi:hypothetical protein
MDGIRFDSKKEATRWWQLRAMETQGQISNLRRQVRFPLEVAGWLVCTYVADFVYIDGAGMEVVEDAKSEYTRKLPVYAIKKKLMLACLGVVIREV